MNLYYFKSDKGNFGDDLNPWLWPQLFDIENIEKETYFLGIGSILNNFDGNLISVKDKKKIVFGTGIRPHVNFSSFQHDQSFDIRFLRGPLSAGMTGNKFPFISDAAYALRQLDSFSADDTPKQYDVSVMPYFKSLDYLDWKAICAKLGYNYISPFSEKGVEFTISEIKKSRLLITEAMHGAIVADIYRVPWHRFIFSGPFTEGSMISEFKWADWLQSVGIYNNTATTIPLYTGNKPINQFQKLTNARFSIGYFYKARVIESLLNKLAGKLPYYLSDDSVVKTVDERMAEELYKLKSIKA